MNVMITAEEMQAVLEKLPQKHPFLFIDRLLELSDEHIVGERRFRPDEYFYSGHFPGDPVTPGVILVEAMAQVGLVAFGIYLLDKERPGVKMRTLFTECAIEFLEIVRPDETVKIFGEKIYWRRNKLQSKVEMKTANGKIVALGTVSGIGVPVE